MWQPAFGMAASMQRHSHAPVIVIGSEQYWVDAR